MVTPLCRQSPPPEDVYRALVVFWDQRANDLLVIKVHGSTSALINSRNFFSQVMLEKLGNGDR